MDIRVKTPDVTICIICNSDEGVHDIFTSPLEDEGVLLYESLENITGVKINTFDAEPLLCGDCKRRLLDAYRFKYQILEACKLLATACYAKPTESSGSIHSAGAQDSSRSIHSAGAQSNSVIDEQFHESHEPRIKIEFDADPEAGVQLKSLIEIETPAIFESPVISQKKVEIDPDRVGTRLRPNTRSSTIMQSRKRQIKPVTRVRKLRKKSAIITAIGPQSNLLIDNVNPPAFELREKRRVKKESGSDGDAASLLHKTQSSCRSKRKAPKPVSKIADPRRNTKKKSVNKALPNKEGPFKCEYCGKTYRYKNNLNQHCRVHTEEKRYACSYCGKKFHIRSAVKIHERIHTNEVPYHCTFCPKAFRYSNSLKIHLSTHSRIKSFICHLCSRGYLHRSNLQEHIKLHYSKKPLKCGFCKNLFIKKSHRNEHMMQCHPKEDRKR